jgi:plasmid stabilization system protein ParE
MKIFFTPRAGKDYDSIKEYLINKWGESIAEEFEQTTVEFLDLLEAFPNLGELDNEKNHIRGFQLTKQTRVLYTVESDHIVIISFF